VKLTEDQIKSKLTGCPGWQSDGKKISKLFTCKSFPDAVAFVTRLGFDAEAADHHPDLHVSYKKVTVSWSTHSEGGVTDKDFNGAKQSDMIAAKFI